MSFDGQSALRTSITLFSLAGSDAKSRAFVVMEAGVGGIKETRLALPFVGSRRCNSCGNKSTIMGEGKAYDCPPQGVVVMADRQQFFRPVEADPELTEILEATKTTAATEEELREQRISFAFGNAPQDSQDRITKDSLRLASEHIRLLP